jgi:CBS domain-containing protein
MKQVRDLVKGHRVITVGKSATVQAAAEIMTRENVGALVVMEGELLVGIFSERDIISRVVSKQLEPAKTSVGSVMTRNIVIALADETVESCLHKMKQANCRHLPVVDGEILLGMLSLRDLLQVAVTEKEGRIEFLQDYMFHLPPAETGG